MNSYSKIWLVTIDTLFFHFNYDSFTAFLKKNRWDWQIKFYLFDHKHFTCVSIKLYNMLYCVCLWSELWIFQAVEKHIFRRTSLWGILWGNSLKYLWMRTHTHKTANFHLIFLPILFQVSKKKNIKGYKVYAEITYQTQMSYIYYEVSFCGSSQETEEILHLWLQCLGFQVTLSHLYTYHGGIREIKTVPIRQ